MKTYFTFAKGEPMSPRADELRIICAGGFVSAMEHIGPVFEKESGYKLFLTVGTPVKTRELMSSGDAFDAAVVTVVSLNETASAAFAPGSRFSVALSPVGMGVRADVAAQPVTSLASFRAAISAVASVGLSDPKAGTNLAADILAAAGKLGFEDELRAKVRYIVGPGSVVSAEIGKGAAEAVMTLGTESGPSQTCAISAISRTRWASGRCSTPAPAVTETRPGTAEFLAFLRDDKTLAMMRDVGLRTNV